MKGFEIFVGKVRMCQVLCLALCLCAGSKLLRALGVFEDFFNTTRVWPFDLQTISIFIEKSLGKLK